MAVLRERGAVPILMTGLHGALPHSPLDQVAGVHGAGKIAPASSRFRPHAEGWSLTSATTHYPGPPTYVGEKGSSFIDHILLPRELLQAIERVHILSSSARRLQLIKSREPRDHRPVLVPPIAQIAAGPLPRRPPRPNREALYRCVQVGFRGGEVLRAMGEEVGKIEDVFETASRIGDVDAMNELLIGALNKAAADQLAEPPCAARAAISTLRRLAPY
eukprot:9503238-Pyramimonas_sp.AAC.1